MAVRSNRELHRHAKNMIGDMVVPEEIAVKHWLVKKREKAAQKAAYIVSGCLRAHFAGLYAWAFGLVWRLYV